MKEQTLAEMAEVCRDKSIPYSQRITALLGIKREAPAIDWDKLREDERLGAACRRLIEDGDVKTMFEVIEGAYMNAWRISNADDVTTRERSHIAICVVDDMRNYLLKAVDKGEAAKKLMEKHSPTE